MTKFGPTRAEMKFRLAVSILGLLLMAFGLAVRGIPADVMIGQLTGLALAFLVASAAFSAWRLGRLED